MEAAPLNAQPLTSDSRWETLTRSNTRLGVWSPLLLCFILSPFSFPPPSLLSLLLFIIIIPVLFIF